MQDSVFSGGVTEVWGHSAELRAGLHPENGRPGSREVLFTTGSPREAPSDPTLCSDSPR